ncbi:PTPLA-domain-containing protein [Phlebopus sp. FC_14]|nr:PTPLA-domain-containing protein [Phlebopus sp. FC_14]
MFKDTSKTRSRGPSASATLYLLAFNVVSAAGWAYVLFLTLDALATKNTAHPLFTRLASYFPSKLPWTTNLYATNQLSTYLSSLLSLYVPSTYSAAWPALAPVQSLAVLEVLHVLLGLVRSPLPTTFIQVSSRLILVWAVVARFPLTHPNPFFTTMVLAWSLTEVPRYTYYALGLAGTQAPTWLTWLRYTTFYVLYPLGAGSEAILALSTIPEWQHGRYLSWRPEDWIKAALVLIWIPGLWVMYTHMIRMRRKVLGVGKGQKLGARPNDRTKAE